MHKMSYLFTILWRRSLSAILWVALLAFLPSGGKMGASDSIAQERLGSVLPAGPGPAHQAGSLTSLHSIPKGKGATTSQRLQAAFRHLPLSFIPNRGQVEERVKFYGRSGSAGFFFTPNEVVYLFLQREETAALRKAGRLAPGLSKMAGSPVLARTDGAQAGQGYSWAKGQARGHIVRLQFVGANPNPVIEGKQEMPGKANYFIGRNPTQWRKGLPTYGQVRYRELWPGIDLIYRGQGGRLKYEFIVKPGADPRRIRLAYQGIEGMKVSDAGDMILKTSSGELRDGRPYAYQEIEGRKVEAKAGFHLVGMKNGNPARTAFSQRFHEESGQSLDPIMEGNPSKGLTFIHGFEAKGYDPAYPLILDPGLEYSTFLGGSANDDMGSEIALDAAGNAYVTGSTAASDFPATSGSVDTSYNVNDAFVAKLSPDGSTLLYATFLGGSGADWGNGIAVDTAGDVYVTGQTSSSDFPATPEALDTNFNGVNDAFVARLSADGSTLLFSTALGGNSQNMGSGIALDNAGNIYVIGNTDSSDFPATPGAFDTNFNGVNDAFVAKLSPDGSALLYATFLGGSDWEWGEGIALDASGNSYMTGRTDSSDFPATPGAFDQTHNGGPDAFVAKLSADGSTLLSPPSWEGSIKTWALGSLWTLRTTFT